MPRRYTPHLRDERSFVERVSPFVVLALLSHVVLFEVGDALAPYWTPELDRAPVPTQLTILEPPPEEPVEEEVPEPELDGQLVEVPPPEEPERPEDPDYLSEHDITVEEETRSDQFKVNPEVLAPEYSEDEKMEQEDAIDLGREEPSTGATPGNDRFDPDRDGNLSSMPSPFTRTNREGLAEPVPAAHSTTAMSGAPQNDLLDEQVGDQTALNTKEYLYAGYLLRIRRLVNFYWEQNVDNLPSSVRLVKSAYTTGVSVVLDSEGALEVIEVTKESGSDPLDDCVVQAFRLAGPFPNPPEGLIEKDGRVYLPSMSFTVRLGQARMQYQGVDPRAGVQFPGILKSPR